VPAQLEVEFASTKIEIQSRIEAIYVADFSSRHCVFTRNIVRDVLDMKKGNLDKCQIRKIKT
jgi:hypothetical protein